MFKKGKKIQIWFLCGEYSQERAKVEMEKPIRKQLLLSKQ